jgi:tRNA modification GTPase
VANKADVGIIQETVDTIIAAKNNVGIAELKDRMWQKAMENRHWDPDRFVLTSARHKRELSSLLEQVNLAIRQLSTQVSGEFVASSLRNALQHLSAITGQISNEDILDSIFSRFCIGK